jgi:hypothetical protein
MKSKSGAKWVRSFGAVFYEMTAKGFKTKLQTMDNEASAALKNYVTEKEMSYQLVSPHCHRTNADESIPNPRSTCGIDFFPRQKSL